MLNNLKTTKQSLCDWQVTIDDKHIGWIRKAKIGYNAEINDRGYKVSYFEPSFIEAKKCFIDWFKD